MHTLCASVSPPPGAAGRGLRGDPRKALSLSSDLVPRPLQPSRPEPPSGHLQLPTHLWDTCEVSWPPEPTKSSWAQRRKSRPVPAT